MNKKTQKGRPPIERELPRLNMTAHEIASRIFDMAEPPQPVPPRPRRAPKKQD